MTKSEFCFYQVADRIKPLSHPLRLRILGKLRNSEACVGDISNIVQAPMTVVSRHLAILLAHDLVAMRRDANRNIYRLKHDGIGVLVEALCNTAAQPATA